MKELFWEFDFFYLNQKLIENISDILLANLIEKQNELVIESDKQSEINNVIFAEGNVAVSYKGKLLKADNLVYDKLSKKVIA